MFEHKNIFSNFVYAKVFKHTILSYRHITFSNENYLQYDLTKYSKHHTYFQPNLKLTNFKYHKNAFKRNLKLIIISLKNIPFFPKLVEIKLYSMRSNLMQRWKTVGADFV